jgi:hypothetical protein
MRTRRPRSAAVAWSAFAGFCFPPEVIVLAVRWYLRFALSYRDVEELLAERGVEVDHVTIYRWVQRFTPLLAEAARPCRHAVGDRWQVDETYVKVAGRWRYVGRTGRSAGTSGPRARSHQVGSGSRRRRNAQGSTGGPVSGSHGWSVSRPEHLTANATDPWLPSSLGVLACFAASCATRGRLEGSRRKSRAPSAASLQP